MPGAVCLVPALPRRHSSTTMGPFGRAPALAPKQIQCGLCDGRGSLACLVEIVAWLHKSRFATSLPNAPVVVRFTEEAAHFALREERREKNPKIVTSSDFF